MRTNQVAEENISLSAVQLSITYYCQFTEGVAELDRIFKKNRQHMINCLTMLMDLLEICKYDRYVLRSARKIQNKISEAFDFIRFSLDVMSDCVLI